MRYLSNPRILFLSPFLLIFLAAGPVFSQETEIAKFPSRPVTLVVPFSAGGSTDLAIRLLAKEAEKHLGQSIVVLNKPGGGGSVGVASVAAAKPDGYTIGHLPGGAPLFIMPFLEKLPYHPLKDFRCIMQLVDLNFAVIVKAGSPFKTFRDLIEYARQNPKKATYGTNAPNSISNLITEQIAKKEGVQFTHIPFKSSPEYQTAVLGGHVQFAVGDFNFSMVEAGETRILLFLGEKRSDEYPQVPVIRELGYDLRCPVILGIFGPKGLPDEIARKLEDALTKATKEPAFIKGMKDLHLTVFYRNSKELTDYVAINFELFHRILKDMNLIK